MKRILYAEAVYGQQEIDAVIEVLKNSPHLLMAGPRVAEFEKRVAALFGKKHGLMVNSGSAANLLTVAALGLDRGAEVITPALTFSTTVAPLVQHGLVPAFVDVEPDTYVVDVDAIEAMIGPRTRALMVPNLIGNLPDWSRLRAIADKHGLILIEDSCDTIGYRFDGGTTGRLSDAATTSFYASHVITAAGFGGMVLFNNDELHERATVLRGWGRASSRMNEMETIESRFQSTIDGIEYDTKFTFDDIGYNFLPSELAAAFGLVQLDRLDDYTQRRTENFARMTDFFRGYEQWFTLPRPSNKARVTWLAVPLIVRDDSPFTRRDLQTHFERAGIQTRTVFTGNVLRQPGFRDIERREPPGGFPNADRVMRGGMLVGCHQGMDSADIEYVQRCFREFAARF